MQHLTNLAEDNSYPAKEISLLAGTKSGQKHVFH